MQAVCLCVLWRGRRIQSVCAVPRSYLTFLFVFTVPRAWRRLVPRSLDPVMFGWAPSGLKRSLQFQKILKLSINFIPWVRHADVSHVFRPRSLLKDSIPFPKLGISPEMYKCCSWQSLSVSSSREKSFFRISEAVFLHRMSKDPVCIIMFISVGCVERIVGNISVSSLTDVLSKVWLSVLAIFTFIESPIRIVSGAAFLLLALSLAVFLGYFSGFG